MSFFFPELDYFIPSASMCNNIREEEIIQFSDRSRVIKCFPFEYLERKATLKFEILCDCQGSVKIRAETVSRLTIEFDETDDLEYILSLYRLIKFFFSLVCNRQNIALESAVLFGIHRYNLSRKGPGGIVEAQEKEGQISSTFYVPEKYQDDPEEPKVIAKTLGYNAFAIEKLFSLIIEDKISVQSIHSSRKARSLLDLKQCLHITAAFEYYLRTFLPQISSQETIEVFDDIKALIKDYIETQQGEKLKKAKRLHKALKPEIPLETIIRKVYDGYDTWNSLKPILSGYFGEDISHLAEVANDWRNELAHEKREYEPSLEIVSAMRLMEHLNYCIVLRQAEYSDEEIKVIVDHVLTR